MDKEKLIDLLLLFLAAIFGDKKINNSRITQINIFSNEQVIIDKVKGKPSLEVRDLRDNYLVTILRDFVSFNWHAEERDYFEAWVSENPDVTEQVGIENIYDSEAVTGHIYHTLRIIKALLNYIDNPE